MWFTLPEMTAAPPPISMETVPLLFNRNVAGFSYSKKTV